MFKIFSAVIVDDEPPARRLLTELLQEHKAIIHIAGEADNGAAAIAIINNIKPDVIFLDIQLPDMLGFDVLKQLKYKPFVIFITAYDEYAIKAFDALSVDYLLKPLKEDRLLRAINKLQHFAGGNMNNEVWNNFESLITGLKPRKEITTLSVKNGTKFTLLQLANVAYFEAYDKYTFVYTVIAQKFFCDYMLAVLEEKLSDDFVRVQKSYIVNKRKIAEIHKYSNNRFTLVLNDKDFTRIVTGPSYFNTIKEVFEV